MKMAKANYDEIATWYNEGLRSGSFNLHELTVPLLELLGKISDRSICDLACGQGSLTRELAQRGAKVVGVDISTELLAIAQGEEANRPLGITYRLDDAQKLATFDDALFDGVVCHLALMDIPDLVATCRAVRRVLRSGGWFVFSIIHPCFFAPHAVWVSKSNGTLFREVTEYFNEGFWQPTHTAGVRGKVGSHHRMLSTYLNTLIQMGLELTHAVEPKAAGSAAKRYTDKAVLPAFMLIRCQKR